MIIEDIKNYLSEDKKEELIKIVDEIYQMTQPLNDIYPNYNTWFFNKQIKGCYTPDRNIIFARDKKCKIVGISSLKKDDKEKKICTLFVDDKYRRRGIGSLLLDESFKFLETTKPFITITEDKLYMFAKLIEKYDWQLTETAYDIYSKGVREFCFNGKLLEKDYRY